MNWKKLSKFEYESDNEKYDFHLRKEDKKWILDIFDKTIQHNSQAYIESFQFTSLKEAQKEAKLYL